MNRTDQRTGWTRRQWLAGSGLLAAAASARAAGPVRVLLVTGGHDHEPSFYSVFDGQNGMTVNVDPHPKAFQRDVASRYDVAVLYDMVQVEEVEEKRRVNLRRFVEGGRGLVVLHHALCSYAGWPWWREVTGVRYVPQGEPGASTYRHDERMRIAPTGEHPVLAGVGALEMVDETYKGLALSPSNRVLLTTDNPTSDGPVAWVSGYSKARVVVIQPGHGSEAHRHAGYRRLVANAVRWCGNA